MSKSKSAPDDILIGRSPKAYDNQEFIHSRDGRVIRLLAEYMQPDQHFRKHNIKQMVVFFGSARTPSKMDFQTKMNNLRAQLDNPRYPDKDAIKKKIAHLEKIQHTTEYYEDAVSLARMISEWSNTLPPSQRLNICTGGGPGAMEAANRGASMAGASTIGLNISLPFEQHPNQFISPHLNFEFHYFFMRKFWFVYLSTAFVVFPGGFGTLDELMEILTLLQTKKLKHTRPIVLYNEKFWKTLLNFDFLIEEGMISADDMQLLKFANTPEEAFNFLKDEITKSGTLKLY